MPLQPAKYGKGLCKECAEKYTPCMCGTCAAQIQRSRQEQARNRENQRKEKYKAALADTRSEFIKTAVIGILLGIIVIWWEADRGILNSFGDYANTVTAWFFVPFGWKFLTYLQSFFQSHYLGHLGFGLYT